jgi:mannose-6-phosphate isomerase-like protein (cupin superfamily)
MTTSQDSKALARADDALRDVEATDSPGPGFGPLLDEPFAAAWAAAPRPSDDVPRTAELRARLFDRVAVSHDAARAMTTSRRARIVSRPLAPGAQWRVLYAADPSRGPMRPGEPERACLVELAPGAAVPSPARADRHREWLVLAGSACLGEERLATRDYHVDPAGQAPAAMLRSEEGATLFLRESRRIAEAGDAPFTVRDAEAGWPAFAPGIRRRVLWECDGEAALLYQADAGALVPHHTHARDEECLMVSGELFLDDVLLRTGDYQLAPAGTRHVTTQTETAVVVFAHGDLDMQFVGG